MGNEEFVENDDGILVDSEGNEPKRGSSQDRINTLTKNWRTTERALVDANEKLSANEVMMKQMGEYTKNLTESVKSIKDGQVDDKTSADLTSLEADIEAVEDEIDAATKDEDMTKVAVLNTKIRRLERKYNKLVTPVVDESKIIAKYKESNETDPNTVSAADEIRVENFKRDNDWYGKDNKMRRFADNLAWEISATGKFNHSQMLEEVKNQTEKEFDYKPAAGVNTVEGGEYGSHNNDNAGDLSLSQDDKNMADGMGISHKDFLAGKKLSRTAVGGVK